MKASWPKDFWREEYLFREALAASVGLHFLLLLSGNMSFQWAKRHVVEIDITNMGPRGAVSAAPRPASPAHKDWVKSKKAATAPIPTKPLVPEPPPPPEIPLGTGQGGENRLTHLPQLLNLSALSAILERFYPQKAREEGREATVVLDIHLGADGAIAGVEVVRSADPDFDDAAVRAAKLLRYRPAYVDGQPVAVKMRQAIQFKLAKDL